MEDREFFDELFAQFAKTTGAENTFWMDEEDEEYYDNGHGTFIVWSVGQDQRKTFVGSFESEADADFLTALHGCFPDLVRRLHAALDEADAADYDRDSRECRIAELDLENEELKEKIEAERGNAAYMSRRVSELEDRLATARAAVSYHRPLG